MRVLKTAGALIAGISIPILCIAAIEGFINLTASPKYGVIAFVLLCIAVLAWPAVNICYEMGSGQGTRLKRRIPQQRKRS